MCLSGCWLDCWPGCFRTASYRSTTFRYKIMTLLRYGLIILTTVIPNNSSLLLLRHLIYKIFFPPYRFYHLLLSVFLSVREFHLEVSAQKTAFVHQIYPTARRFCRGFQGRFQTTWSMLLSHPPN